MDYAQRLEVVNILLTALVWAVIVGGMIFLAYKSGDMVDFVKDMIREWKRR
jgi:hypothetical protein